MQVLNQLLCLASKVLNARQLQHIRMAIVEDYVPDSDDEEAADSFIPVQPPVPDRAVKQQQSHGQATKASSITELIEQLRVPEAFNDTLLSSQLSK